MIGRGEIREMIILFGHVGFVSRETDVARKDKRHGLDLYDVDDHFRDSRR